MISAKNMWQAHRFVCSCGSVHSQPIKEIVIAQGALHKLGKIRETLGDHYQKGLLLIDSLMNECIGNDIWTVLEEGGIDYSLCLFDSPAVLPNEAAIVKILREMDDSIDFLAAAGSGAINDLARFVSSRCQIPYISIPTAASMDGYSAEVSLLVLDGIKTTVNATHPTAIYADTNVLKTAPLKLVAAGFGDLICKKTAAFDWRISHLINGERYCQHIVDVVDQMVETVSSQADHMMAREEDAIKSLAEGLMISGIAMHWAGSSRPAAGAEHHLAHFIGMKAMMKGQPAHPHGIEVAVMTLVMIEVYRQILSVDRSQADIAAAFVRSLKKEQYEQRIREVFGESAPQIFRENAHKIFDREEWLAHGQKVRENMTQIRKELLPKIPDPDHIAALLRSMGAPSTPKELGLGKEELKEAIRYAKEVRNKYTLLDAAEYLGCLEETAEIVAAKLSC